MAVTSFSWDSVSNLWQAQNMLDDGFLQCCNSIGRDLSPLTDAELSPVNKERLVCLSCADITIPGTRTTWYEVQALPSFDMTSEEVCNRVTFSHDPDVQSRGLRFRRLQQYSVLRNEILADNVAFPDHLSALRANARIQYPAVSGCFDYNIATSNGEYPAIFVYLGEIPESMAREKMEDLEDILKDSRRALVVWFRQDGQIKYLFPEGLNHFDSALEESPKSFLKDV